MEKKKLLPPDYFFGAAILMIILHLVFPWIEIVKTPLNYSGLIFMTAGIAVSFSASEYFKKLKTTVYPFEESTKLAKSGLFNYSRNPMYLGMIIFLIGFWILLGSLTPFVIIILFFEIISNRFIKIEEKMLQEKFGMEYVNYKKNVRRWI